MRKSILMIAAIGVAACALPACSCNGDSEFYQYEQLGSKLKENYSLIVLTVTNTFDEETSLKSEYIMKYSQEEITVKYTVERFAEISLDKPSTETTVTTTGTAVIKEGVISGGEEVGLTADIAYPYFNFKPAYFENATLTDVYFKADVKNVASFWGLALSCTDMKVEANFRDVFYNININYTQNGNKVEYLYEFAG